MAWNINSRHSQRIPNAFAKKLGHNLCIVLAIVLVGCPSSGGVKEQAASPKTFSPVVLEQASNVRGKDDPLVQRVERLLSHNRKHRQLDTSVHGGWQIMHGLLAYRDQLEINAPAGPTAKPETINALRYLLAGGVIDGVRPRAGDAIDDTVGVKFDFQPSTKVGQGHRDQWFAILSQCQLDEQTALVLPGEPTNKFTITNLVRQAEFDVPLNVEEEFSWTLLGLLAYRDTEHAWTSRDGETYSTELLLNVELNQSIETSVCGGTHRLIAIATAVNHRREEKRPLLGVWRDAADQVAAAIRLANQNQNPDGSYSLAYLHRQGWARDLGEQIGATGHVLEFLAIAANPEELRKPWVRRTVVRLCDLLDQCDDFDLECGVLYHALHGLRAYQSAMTAASA